MAEKPIVATLPELLHFHPEWFTDPPPPWIWTVIQEVLDRRQVIEITKAYVDARKNILTAQKTAIEAQVRALDAQIKVNDLVGKMVAGVKPA